MVDTSDKLLRERGSRMTTKTRREFTDEFKHEAVSLLESSGRPLTQVATELGIQPSMLRAWGGRARTSPGFGGNPGQAWRVGAFCGAG